MPTTKPDGCRACPMYQTGEGFCADDLAPDETAAVLIVGQNPGREEEVAGRCFVGKTGQFLDTELLPLTGLRRGVEVSLASTLRCRWQGTNDMPPAAVYHEAVQRCRQYDTVQPHIRLLVAAGGPAWELLAPGVGKVTEWRGFVWSTNAPE